MPLLRRCSRPGPARRTPNWVAAPLRIAPRILRRSTQLHREGGIRLAPSALSLAVTLLAFIASILVARAPPHDVIIPIVAVVSVVTITITGHLVPGGLRVGPAPAYLPVRGSMLAWRSCRAGTR